MCDDCCSWDLVLNPFSLRQLRFFANAFTLTPYNGAEALVGGGPGRWWPAGSGLPGEGAPVGQRRGSEAQATTWDGDAPPSAHIGVELLLLGNQRIYLLCSGRGRRAPSLGPMLLMAHRHHFCRTHRTSPRPSPAGAGLSALSPRGHSLCVCPALPSAPQDKGQRPPAEL